MKLSTRGRYAVTAMLDLTLHGEQEPVALADISTAQGISLSYLEQLFARLRQQGLVRGTRGPGGGYQLARSAQQISVAEVIRAVDEPLAITRCEGRANCREGEMCLTHALWADLASEIETFLSRISLADLVERHRRSAASRTASVPSCAPPALKALEAEHLGVDTAAGAGCNLDGR